jgi:hypothetical protein
VFGLATLNSVPSFAPAGTINQGNAAFCGVNVGPLLAASEVREAMKRRVLSGEHNSTSEEVKSQMYWPHMLLDSAMAPVRPDFKSLTPKQFVAGYSAMILMYLPEELDGTPTANMLRHLNRVMTYALVSDWKHLLAFNAQFFKSCENHAMSFARWDPMQSWHTRHLESIRLSGMKRPEKNPASGGGGSGAPKNPKKNPSDNAGDGEKGNAKKNPVSNHWLRSKRLCLKFQKDTCDHHNDHPMGATTVIHACGLCLFKDNALVKDHGLCNCTKKDF